MKFANLKTNSYAQKNRILKKARSKRESARAVGSRSFTPYTIQKSNSLNSKPSQSDQPLKELTTNLPSSSKTSKQSSRPVHMQHLLQTFQFLKLIESLPEPSNEEIQNKQVFLPRKPGWESKKTLVLDMDETLVHCAEAFKPGLTSLDITFPSGDISKVFISIRPFVKELLVSANQDFEVIVFTASHKCYADRVLDHLDPTHELIHHRLYRENCIVKNGLYIKDLRVLADRKLEDVVIVDNAAYTFAYQLHNGLPIVSWYDDSTDRELLKVGHYLKRLAVEADVRELNKKTFRLDTFCEEYMAQATRNKENE